ncbi:MAG: hypothetical protein ACK559_06265, partial [bacterium]
MQSSRVHTGLLSGRKQAPARCTKGCNQVGCSQKGHPCACADARRASECRQRVGVKDVGPQTAFTVEEHGRLWRRQLTNGPANRRALLQLG